MVAILIGVALSVCSQSAGAAQARYPVTYDFLASAITAGAKVDADPPGANDWHCRPSAAHPEPVVLVHGTFGNKNTNWQTYAPLLANNGYCVFALTYGVRPGSGVPVNQLGGVDLIEHSAAQLARFVDRVLAATGARKVDIVGHSQGTLMPDYYAKFLGGAAKIDKYISLAPLWHGSGMQGFSQLDPVASKIFGRDLSSVVAPSLSEMRPGSPLLGKINAGGPAVRGIRYTNIMTTHDELVTPYTSGFARGMTNIVLQNRCAEDYTEHFEIASDPIASVYVLNALDPQHPRPVPCEVVLPYVGPPTATNQPVP